MSARIPYEELQGVFQRAILDGDDAVLATILDGPRETRGTLFDVYRNAYRLRLLEALRNENAILHAYLGDDDFEDVAAAFIEANPSRHANLRWYSQRLPDFLAVTPPFDSAPEVAELSRIETALADAFDATDAPVLGLDGFAGIEPGSWSHLVFTPHPSARRLDLKTNAFDIWSALVEEAAAPEAETRDGPERLIVWREDLSPIVRPMQAEEAMMWDEAASGLPFGTLCEMAATYADPENAAGRAAGYLQGWVNAGLLSGLAIDPDAASERD